MLVIGRLAVGAPHPLERAGIRVEHDDAVIAVAVGDEQLVGRCVHEDTGGAVDVAGVVAVRGGALLGIPVLRMRGDYLAIVTLGFGEIIRIVLNNLDSVTNGPRGLLRIDPPMIGDYIVNSPARWYYMILAGIF